MSPLPNSRPVGKFTIDLKIEHAMPPLIRRHFGSQFGPIEALPKSKIILTITAPTGARTRVIAEMRPGLDDEPALDMVFGSDELDALTALLRAANNDPEDHVTSAMVAT